MAEKRLRTVGVLKNHEINTNMSRKGNPYDNAFAESFMKTLKTEEVYLWEYRPSKTFRVGFLTSLKKYVIKKVACLTRIPTLD